MDWAMLGSLAELVGALAVVVSLIYVGRQVQDTTKATRAQAYQALVSELAALQAGTAQSERLSAVFHRVLFQDVGLSDFDDADRMSLILMFAAQTRIYEAVYRQMQDGVLDESALRMVSGLRALRTRAFADGWVTLRGTLDEDFVSYIERMHGLTPQGQTESDSD